MTTAPPPGARSLPAAMRQLRATPPPGFTERVLTQIGLDAEDDRYVLLDGPTGPLFIAFSPRGISHVVAADVLDREPRRFEAQHLIRFGRPARVATRPPTGLRAALRTGQVQDLTFDLRGLSDFEQAVLRKALDIPKGELRPYAWLAQEIERPKAVRAVGSALGHNPVPILIPCHRVVRSDGQIGEYVFGSSMKRALLGSEAIDVTEVERLARSGVRLIGCDTTGIFCFPTCRHVSRLTSPHRVPFRSTAQAEGAGYRPCADCRPRPRLTA